MKKIFSNSQKTFTYLNRSKFYAPKYGFSTKRSITTNYDIDFPFKLDGVTDKMDHTVSERLYGVLHKVYGPDIHKGFKMAFKNSLDALESYDLSYFEEICELKLYTTIRDSLENLQKEGYTIKCSDVDGDKVVSSVSKISIILGVSIDRNDNSSLENYTKTELTLMNFRLVIYAPKSGFQSTSVKDGLPFMQCEIVYASPLKIELYDKNGNLVNKKSANGRHKFLFENEVEYDEERVKETFKKTKNFASLFSIISNSDAAKPVFDDIFKGQNYTWKIVDIDDYLSGNQHAS